MSIAFSADELRTLAALDFEETLSCDMSEHSTHHNTVEPASWWVQVRCPCNWSWQGAVCVSGMARVRLMGARCPSCGRVVPRSVLRRREHYLW